MRESESDAVRGGRGLDARGTGAWASVDGQLRPEDFELALRRMKRELALTSLRRSLLDPTLDAEATLAIVRRISAIQAEAHEAPRPRVRLRLAEILRLVAF